MSILGLGVEPDRLKTRTKVYDFPIDINSAPVLTWIDLIVLILFMKSDQIDLHKHLSEPETECSDQKETFRVAT